MKHIYSIFTLLLFQSLCAQPQVVAPIASINNYKNTEHNLNHLYKVISSDNGDSYVLGTSNQTFSTRDVFVSKLNSNLDTLWTYVIDTPDHYSIDEFKNAEIDSNGNLYIHSLNLIYFNYYETTSKHYVTKLSASGELIYQKNLDEIAQENGDFFSYLTTNRPYTFSHIDSNDNFVIVFNHLSPLNQITFIKFLQNNTSQIVHRNDILPYDEMVDHYGYMSRFYYLNGAYYYFTSVKKLESYTSYEYRINKMLEQGYVSLNLTPIVPSNQIFVDFRSTELKSNENHSVLYFTFDSKYISDSYFTFATTSDLSLLGHYHDSVRYNKFHDSQILNNGNIRLFGNSFLNYNATESQLSEVTLSTTGNVIQDSLHPDFDANRLITVNNDYIGVVYNDSVAIVNTNWETDFDFSNISVRDAKSIIKRDSTFYLYGEKYGTYSSFLPENTSDIKTIAYRVKDKDTEVKTYEYQGEGNASCSVHIRNQFMSDLSSVFTYYCVDGDNSKEYIKKVDSEYNELFDIELEKRVVNNMIIDEDDNIYYTTLASLGPYTTQYYLNKRNSDGELLFEIPYSQFNELLYFNNKLYTISYNEELSNSFEINKTTGNPIQNIDFVKNRPIANIIDGNDNYRYYLTTENIPDAYIWNTYVKVYKNFQLYQTTSLGYNYETAISSAVVDEEENTIYFSLYNSLQAVNTLFKCNLDGGFSSTLVQNNISPLFVINNSVYLTSTESLIQRDKNTLTQINELDGVFINRYHKYKNFIFKTLGLNKEITVLDENLQEVAEIHIANNFHFINIDPLDRLHFNNSFTQSYLLDSTIDWQISNIQLYDFSFLTLDLGNFDKKSEHLFKIYPNPTENILNIASADIQQIDEMYIYDITGKRLLIATKDQVEKKNIDVSSLSSGVYIVQIISNSKNYSIKFLKE